MENPDLAKEQEEEREAQEIARRFAHEDAWEAATTGDGYKGERGTFKWPTSE